MHYAVALVWQVLAAMHHSPWDGCMHAHTVDAHLHGETLAAGKLASINFHVTHSSHDTHDISCVYQHE